MADHVTERRLAAIMLTDIIGFSTLMERAESQTFDRVRRLRDEVSIPIVGQHGGRIIKNMGDGFLAEFPSSTAAVLCGIAIQRINSTRQAELPDAERLRLRIGINLGDIIIDGDDVAGDGVNIAARLERLSPINGLCISGAVKDQLREESGVAVADLGMLKLKNIARPIRAFTLSIDGVSVSAGAAPRRGARPLALLACLLASAAAVGLALYVYAGRTPAPASAQASPGPAGAVLPQAPARLA